VKNYPKIKSKQSKTYVKVYKSTRKRDKGIII